MPMESTATRSLIIKEELEFEMIEDRGVFGTEKLWWSATNERERALVDFDSLGKGGTFSGMVFRFLRSREGCLDSLRCVGIVLTAIPPDVVGNLDIFK